jgi:peptide/nickel transport system permease protein
MPRVLRFVARRLVQAIPIILGIRVLNFLLLHLAPGDVVDVLAGEAGAATAEFMTELRRQFGLDRPLLVQLWQYLEQTVRLELGFSFRHSRPVSELILQRLPPTLLLMSVSLALAVALGILLGITAARYVRRLPDNVISVLALLSYATPIFWSGLMMIVLFAVKLRWLPSTGLETVGAGYTGWARLADIGGHTVMPAVALSLFYMAIYTRLMRASMLEVYGQDYVRTALAKGVPERRIAFAHVFRNALLPIVTMAGMQIGSLLGGSVMVETVFGWPGLGRLTFEAVFTRDYNLLLGILFISSTLVVMVNIVVDVLYAVLDPRIEVK